ncbi:MAG: nucleotidyltransferase [Chloroflexota bacterium]|nr:nucleotidyltransferase [Chloroflexota bacterium]
MDNPFRSIEILQKRLLDSGFQSIVIGGVAVGIWGEPRVTRDIDLKVLFSRSEADRLLEILSDEYLSLIPNPLEALKKQALVFVKDEYGTRLDLLLADTPYDVIAIERGKEIVIQSETHIRVCSPEDLIIYKMISNRLRDHEDVRGIIRRQGNLLDDEYVLDWLRQFEQALDISGLTEEYMQLKQGHRLQSSWLSDT